jgi:hypothetical protein
MYGLYGFIITNEIWSLLDKADWRQKTLESYDLIQWTVGETHGATEEICDATTESD